MPSRTSPSGRPILPWWLDGEQECPHCHQLYAYEIEVRCPECDEPSCPYCVRRHVERGIVCVACSEDCDAAAETSHG